MRFYTGIGSREIPYELRGQINKLALFLLDEGLILRSGGADGADSMFEEKIPIGKKQIYLPWKRFNANPSNLYKVTYEAKELARHFHPKWNELSDSVRCLMGRNAYQILGKDLNSPSTFVVCWTPDGKKTGGTGTTMRIAESYGIPIFNIYNDSWHDNLLEYWKFHKSEWI